MAIAVVVDSRELTIGMGQFKGEVSDKASLLRIAGALMLGSIARTFREEGSPAGSWARLALSTLKKKGYTAGHKLLILSGRLFGSQSTSVSVPDMLPANAGTLIGSGSIKYEISGGVLTIGTNLVYAAVHQWGSKDRAITVGEHDYMRVSAFKRYGRTMITDKKGVDRMMPRRLQGPANAQRVHVGEHRRHQNIPPRPYLVFRPEDAGRIATAFERYLGGKAVSIGKVGAR